VWVKGSGAEEADGLRLACHLVREVLLERHFVGRRLESPWRA
jgi:hypothetical protein